MKKAMEPVEAQKVGKAVKAGKEENKMPQFSAGWREDNKYIIDEHVHKAAKYVFMNHVLLRDGLA